MAGMSSAAHTNATKRLHTAQPAKKHPDMKGLELKLNGKSPVNSNIAKEMGVQTLNGRGEECKTKGKRKFDTNQIQTECVPVLLRPCTAS